MLFRCFCWMPAAVLVVLLGGVFTGGCGAGNPSGLFARAGLFPNRGTGPVIPTPIPDDTQNQDDNTTPNGTGDGTSICITFVNDGNEDARVFLYSSTSFTIGFLDLVDSDNLELLPSNDQDCVDENNIVGPREIAPAILDGLRLHYQLECTQAASIAVGVTAVDGTVLVPDDRVGPFRQQIDFACGDNLIVRVTDTNGDEDFEIGF